MSEVILIQPCEGVYNKVFKPWVPLSLLSTGAKLDLEGYRITIIDLRVHRDWKKRLTQASSRNPICVGVTSMTGSQILTALEATKFTKQISAIPVVWGGVHASIFPRQTLKHPDIDIVVKGEGEETFYQLVKKLEEKKPLEGLSGVCYKINGQYYENPDRPFIRLDDHPEPAYHLVNITDYLHSYFSEKRVMELESSRGCPFACGFCYNALYNKRSWRPLSPERVVERIKKLQTDYQVEVFHFIDDAFFVDKRRAIKILQMICDENLQIRIGFQGIRVDTFVRMGEDFIPLMDKAGVRFLQFGVESGSPRILKLINKKIKVEDVVHINRLLSNYPRIIPYYNFMCGFPTEDREDVYKSTALAWNLLRDNKQALISPFHHYRPYPGTALADTAIKGCYKVPDSLEGWGTFDWTNSSTKDLDAKMYRLFKKIEMTSILADDKLKIQSDSAFWSIATKLYQPLARFRLKNNFYSLMPESVIMRK